MGHYSYTSLFCHHAIIFPLSTSKIVYIMNFYAYIFLEPLGADISYM